MKILIVDDHSMVRAGLQRLLADSGAQLFEAETGAQGLALLRSEKPDLAILDLNLPGLGGLELIRRFRREAPATQVLVLSMQAEKLYAVHALEAGAGGYVTKNASPEELTTAIGTVSHGGRYIEAELAQAIALDRAGGGGASLTPREVEILRLLRQGAGLGQIAAALGLGYKTVANNCTQLKAKLGVSRTADLIRFAADAWSADG